MSSVGGPGLRKRSKMDHSWSHFHQEEEQREVRLDGGKLSIDSTGSLCRSTFLNLMASRWVRYSVLGNVLGIVRNGSCKTSGAPCLEKGSAGKAETETQEDLAALHGQKERLRIGLVIRLRFSSLVSDWSCESSSCLLLARLYSSIARIAKCVADVVKTRAFYQLLEMHFCTDSPRRLRLLT